MLEKTEVGCSLGDILARYGHNYRYLPARPWARTRHIFNRSNVPILVLFPIFSFMENKRSTAGGGLTTPMAEQD